jgi:hypothetical protein
MYKPYFYLFIFGVLTPLSANNFSGDGNWLQLPYDRDHDGSWCCEI